MHPALSIAASLGLIAGAAQAADPSSDKWIDKRNQLFADVCIGSAPLFARFEKMAVGAGFHKENDVWIYGSTEIVASLSNKNQHCTCLFSYGTDNPSKAVLRLGQKLLTKFETKVRPTKSEKTFADIDIGDEKVTLMITMLDRGEDGKWLGLHLIGPENCPAD